MLANTCSLYWKCLGFWELQHFDISGLDDCMNNWVVLCVCLLSICSPERWLSFWTWRWSVWSLMIFHFRKPRVTFSMPRKMLVETLLVVKWSQDKHIHLMRRDLKTVTPNICSICLFIFFEDIVEIKWHAGWSLNGDYSK